MSKQREALELALEAMNNFDYQWYEAKDAIREALAEPEPWTPDDMAYRPGGLAMDLPPNRKPLTDEQIDAEFNRETWVTVVFADGARGIALDKVTARDFARAIERAIWDR